MLDKTYNMKIINLTPHAVRVHDMEPSAASGHYVEFPSEGVARVLVVETQIADIDGFPLVRTTYGETTGLPAPAPDTYYIVSMVVGQANPDRRDLICPNSSPASVRRDENGQIFSVAGFVSYAK